MHYLEHIRRESETLLAVALDGSMEVAVPSCPAWSMTDLLGHVGVVQRFHGWHITRGVTDPPTRPRPTPPETGLASWFREGLEELLATLDRLGLDSPAWNFLGCEPLTTGFWHRRMAHEAAVHRWDAEFARGRARGFDPELVRDGIDEVIDHWLPARRSQDAPQGTAVIVVAGDRPRTVVAGEADASRATIAGSADDVLLALWGRIPLTDLDVEGNLELARSIRI